MSKLPIRDGSSQEHRLLPALTQGYVNVDETRFEDFLSMTAEYARLVKFPNAANLPAGDWREYFESDEIFILSSLLAINLESIEADHSSISKNFDATIAQLKHGNTSVDILPAFNLARRIDNCYRQLGALTSVAAVRAREKIAEVIKNTLQGKLHQLQEFLQTCEVKSAAEEFLSFSAVWRGGEEPAVEQSDARQFLKSNFYSFYNAMVFLQGCSADLLLLSLERHNHDPAIGLFIAFLQLFKKVQGKINDFTARHLTFYYEEVLKTRRRDFVPDSVHLLFYPDTAGREVLIDKDTEFVAGLDENKIDRIYGADSELLVTDARVCALYTLYFGRNALSSPENALVAASSGSDKTRNYVTSAKLNRIAKADGPPLPLSGAAKAHPLFGALPRAGEKRLFEEARVGFAIATSVLLLKQGQRDIILTFKLGSEPDCDTLESFIDKLSEVLSTTRADAFFKAFRSMFHIFLTSESGWLEVEEYLPLSHSVDNAGCAENVLKIKMRLPDSASAVVPYAADIHGDCFDTGLPVMKLVVNPDNYLYPYSLLCNMVVQEIVIEVEVAGYSNALIYSQLGQLSANAQFNPFGASPSAGDYLIVGSYETARKKLTDFELDIEWAGLPQDINGFSEYYQAYAMPFGNSEFQVSLAALRDRKWMPANEELQPKTELFDSLTNPDRSEQNMVSKTRRISLRDVCQFVRPVKNVSDEQYGYDVTTKDGFFKLTLKDPPYAFGHKDYPLALSKAMTENASRKSTGFLKKLWKEAPAKPLPNVPYTPLVNSIIINYKAVAHLNLEQIASDEEGRLKEQIYHLHPDGVESLSPKAYRKIHLVPQYSEDGNLLIGISATRLAGPITLFFNLREDSKPEAGQMTFDFHWHYLASNQWKPLESSQVVSDTTYGFLSSGIVTLDIPDDIDLKSTILPPNLYWIKVSANSSHLHTLCSLYGVHTHALKATWKRQAGNSLSHLASRLPRGTVSEARVSIPGISSIFQVKDSFGAEPTENDRQRTVRVSERLRHKNRAITPWDFERLILQQFPQIFKAKCFPCMTGKSTDGSQVAPGQLLIVLIPRLRESASANMQPMVNALILREVREYLKSLASDFVEINVRNPAYEQIQVRCKIRFKKGYRKGFYLSELNQEIISYLSPWSTSGFEAKFGWRLRCDEIQSYISGLKYVAAVSGLSLVQIRQGDDRYYQLSDTARELANEAVPAYPWSIAIPARQHLIEVVDQPGTWPREKTGISDLSIGSTFILS